MKKSLLSLILLWCMVAVCSCSSDIELDSGGIAGSVSDATTGEPVSTVNVTLNPGGKSTVTGSDGTFSFNNLEAGEYTLDISKEGYKANSATVTVKNGEPVPAHLLIERIPAIVTADRDTLDFGDNQSLNTMSFNIVNSSYEDLEWEIEERCDWITEIKPAKGTLKYGKTEGIVVIIDRTKLSKGVNKAVIVIRSSNGSSQMNVLATGAQAIVTADRDTLDFGDNQSLNTMSFNIVNSTYEDLEWEIEERCDWITEIKPAKGTLKHGKTEGVAVIIDRARLSKGVNKAMIIINSSYGSLEMNVLATGTEIVLPKLNVLAATTISISSAQLNGEIIDDGIPAYSERGFVYSLNSMPTLENTISKLTCTSNSNKTYSYLLNELSPNTTYFVRAYAKSSKGVVYSVNEIKFKTLVATPKVTTLEIANIDLSNGTATFRGEITYAGIPSYTERGFVYSTLPEPTIYDNKVIAGGAGTVGGFSKYVTNLPKSTYYVRAYAIASTGTVYGEEKIVEAEWVEIPAAGIAVQIRDLDRAIYWESAKLMCENSTVGGYSDWRLPTRAELMAVYNNRDKIGGFTGYNSYWTSEFSHRQADSTGRYFYYYYALDFCYGTILKEAGLGNVRAVRTLKK